MSPQLELFFDFRSPYSYLAFSQLRLMDAELRVRPLSVLKLMEGVGNVPTNITCAAKRRYAQADVRRWAQRYGLAINPSDMRGNDGEACARAVLSAATPAQAVDITQALFHASWSAARPLATHDDILSTLAEADIDTAGLADRMDAAETLAQLEANAREAAERGVFGVPTIFVGEAMFFGNDRLAFVREALDPLGSAA